MPRKRQAIRDHSAEANLFARRSVIAMLLVLLSLGLVVHNLYNLQITQHDSYQTRSNDNRIKLIPVAPNRGLIYDRNGVILAENRPVFSLEIIPEQIKDLSETLERLSSLLSLSDDEVKSFYKDLKRQRRFKPVVLRTIMSENDVSLFSVRAHEFPGVYVQARLSRHYPYGELLTHALGYVAKINKKDLQKLVVAGQEDNYAATYDIGKIGIEKYHEELLHGTVGSQQVEVNNQGRIIHTLNVDPPIPGTDIILNIDVKLQLAAKQALQNARGTVVMLEPTTGAVLAMYSNPSYDPNLFVHGISSKNYSALLNSNDRPLINRATQGQYPPASTVKPHLAWLGLEKDIITLQTTIYDNGRYQLPNVDHVWRDWKKWGHGRVNVVQSIEQSCDTFFYDLAYKLGIDRISESMSEFGFGDYTGIDLYEESGGNMPNRGWKRARFNQPWYIGDTIPVGIGQGFWTATPIQLVHSITTLINHGERTVPQILRGYLINGETVLEEPKTLRPIQSKYEDSWLTVLDAMYGTVNRAHGTARMAFESASYDSAGKTGTAQLFTIGQNEEYEEQQIAERLRDNAMYVGFAPYNNPEVAIVVVLENAGGGSSNAAPIARKMLDAYFSPELIDLNQYKATETSQ